MQPICERKITLNNGTKIPIVGFGTFRIRQGDQVMKAVDYALDAGYRLFDTAAVYGNEILLGSAFKTLLPKYGLKREDIFITTKLSPSNHGDFKTVESAYLQSINNLGMSYVDLYLIHFPGTAKIPTHDERNAKLRELTWEAMASLYNDGRVKAIGVSNFTVKHLKELMSWNHGVTPAVNQVEWHPYYHQEELLKYCKENKIALQAYCSFGGASSGNLKLLEDPVVIRLAKKYEVTCSQVVLAWATQQGVLVIPKSLNAEHINENINLNFTMSPEDLKSLDDLGDARTKYAWDPSPVH